jgi:uncharacterized membrane protein YsdA (DUF1294 family)
MKETFIDKIIMTILTPIFSLLGSIINLLLSNRILTTILFIILINIIGYILMKKDKKYAEEGKWRIKESTLFITALVGGSIGIYLGMKRFKHKTKHPKFSIVVPAIIFTQIAYLLYLGVTYIIK